MSETQKNSPKERLTEIKKLGDTPQAIAKIQELLQEKPRFVRGWIELGLIYRRTGDRQSALEAFASVLKCNPKAVGASLNLAIELQHLGKYAQAKQCLLEVIKDFPDHFRVLMQLGHFARKQGKVKHALKWYSLASTKATNSPEFVDATICSAEEFRKSGEIERGLSTIESALTKSPKNIRANLVCGRLLKQKCNFTDAAATFRRVIELSPSNLEAHQQLGLCLGQLNRFSAATEISKQAESLAPKNIQVLNQIANLYRQQGKREKALEYYQKSSAIASNNINITLNLATELEELGKLPAALKIINQILQDHPYNFQALMQRGKLAQKRQQFKVALEYFQQAHLHHPEEIKPQLQKVQVLNGMGLCSQARQQLELLQNNYPDSFLVMMQSGHFFRQLHQRVEALQWYCLAQSKAPSSANSLEAELCSVEELRDLGRFDEAKKQIEAIISQFPHNIRAQLIQASIWQKTAKFAAATQIYEEILSIEPEHLPAQMKLAQIYSQSGQVEKAIALLEAADQSSARNMQLLSRLGTLYQAIDHWDAARQYYQRMCEEYPDSPQGYCLIANLMFLKGKGEAALTLLKQVQARLPDSAQIVQKLVEIQLRLGYLDAANRLLDEKIVRFPTHVQLHWQRCRLYLEQGDNLKALKALEQITTDNQDWILQTESLKARIYFHQYNYYQAEAHLKKAISAAAVAIAQRNLLASAKMLTGRFDEASQELKLATQELKLKSQPGKVAVPLRGHCAMIVNELRINPPLLTQLQAIEKLTGFTKIVELGNLLVKEPNYFGTALYLAKELRQQGIFDLVKDSLSSTKAGSVPSIPSKIVQYWNDPNPPADVERVCQSWIEQNPGYEYIRFSEDEAIAFLHHHYDKRVVNAFNNCDEAATQSDFFRLAYLNQMGGFYADTDDLCRQPLNTITRLNPELVVLQEDLSCIGNNFFGCIPHQSAIRTAFYQAVNNLNYYCNESPWFKTGPALLTSVICSSLVPYLTYADYQMWPRLLVLSQAEIRKIICPHLFLAYKNTSKSWQRGAYQRRIKSSS